MALKIEHTCTRCKKVSQSEVQDVAAAQARDELDKKRAETLEKLKEFVAGIAPELLPDVFIVRGDAEAIGHITLCDEEDAKRSCLKRVDALVAECDALAPRKPKTKKTPPPPAT